MTDYHHLSTRNAERTCGACGDRRATAYVHGTGLRCGECADVPETCRAFHAGEGAAGSTDPRRNGAGAE